MHASDDIVVFDQYGHEVPFPKSALIPFPWEKIEGIWQATVDKMEGYFAFSIDRSSTQRALKVIYWNEARTQVIAEGIGYLSEDAKVIRAVMKGPEFNYLLSVGAYSLKFSGISKTEMVTSLRPVRKTPATLSNFIIRRVN